MQKIDPKSETLILESVSEISVKNLGSTLPASEPCYAFFAWSTSDNSSPRREIGEFWVRFIPCLLSEFNRVVFIYSCPSTSPIKHRMLYSSGASSVFQASGSILSSRTSSYLAGRKIETSDPKELDEMYIMTELGRIASGTFADGENNGTMGSKGLSDDKKPFARPKGPSKKR